MRPLDRTNEHRLEAHRQLVALRQLLDDDRAMRVRMRGLASELMEQRLRIRDRFGERG